MKVCVFGAGAIGGHLAVRLARGGADVSVVARGAQLAAIQQNGLKVVTSNPVAVRAHHLRSSLLICVYLRFPFLLPGRDETDAPAPS